MERRVILLSSFRRAKYVVAFVVVGSCGADAAVECVALPCAMPMALLITVSNAATGGAVSNVTFRSQGNVTSEGPCNGTPTTCPIAGTPGSYTVTISAPGFQTATRNFTVTGAEATDCHCAVVNTEHLSVALVPN